MAHRRPPASFLGWRIVLLAGLAGTMTGPGQSIGVSAFRSAMVDDLATTDTALSTAYMVGTLVASTFLPGIGRWVDRVGARRAMTVVAIAFAAVLAHMSAITHVAWLAVGFLGIRVMGQGALSLVSTVVVTHWFRRRRGLALGVKMTLMAGGMSMMPLLLSVGVRELGWRWTWLAAAAAVLAVVVPVARLGIVDRPEEVGQHPDGGSVLLSEPTPVVEGSVEGVDRRKVVRSPAFLVLAAVAAANSVLITGMVFHQTNVLGEVGYSNTRAAAMFLPQAIGAVGGGLAFGWLSDRRFRAIMPGVVAVLLAATCLLGGMGSTGLEVFAYSVLVGTCTGGGAAVNATLLPHLFGVQSIGAVSGMMHVVSVVSSSLGAVAFSVGADLFGDYRSAMVAFAIWPGITAVVALALRPTPRLPDGGGGSFRRSPQLGP
jgi:MFS family permease